MAMSAISTFQIHQQVEKLCRDAHLIQLKNGTMVEIDRPGFWIYANIPGWAVLKDAAGSDVFGMGPPFH